MAVQYNRNQKPVQPRPKPPHPDQQSPSEGLRLMGYQPMSRQLDFKSTLESESQLMDLHFWRMERVFAWFHGTLEQWEWDNPMSREAANDTVHRARQQLEARLDLECSADPCASLWLLPPRGVIEGACKTIDELYARCDASEQGKSPSGGICE